MINLKLKMIIFKEKIVCSVIFASSIMWTFYATVQISFIELWEFRSLKNLKSSVKAFDKQKVLQLPTKTHKTTFVFLLIRAQKVVKCVQSNL